MNERAELIRYRIARARETLQAARLLAGAGHHHAAVNRLYYACFYAVSALLLNEGLSASKHSGVFALFNQRWIKSGRLPMDIGRLYNALFDARQEADYADLAEFTAHEVAEWTESVDCFLTAIEGNLAQ